MVEILLVVAHPDDEVIWCGSTMYEFTKLNNVNVNVINLWGILEPPGSMQAIQPGYKDIDRKDQFNDVCRNMNYSKYHAITDVDTPVFKGMRQTNDNIEREFEKALKLLDINIDLMITHSYYGDERGHPGHIATHNFANNYCKKYNIPFTFFSVMQIPVSHTPVKTGTYRTNDLHLVSYSKCDDNLFHIQFQGNLSKKLESLRLYKAIDFDIHYNCYAAFSLVTEGFYMDKNSKEFIDKHIINQLTKISVV